MTPEEDRARRARDALARIVIDPSETPERRARAEEALETCDWTGYPVSSLYAETGHHYHSSGGSQSLRQDAVYDGWGKE